MLFILYHYIVIIIIIALCSPPLLQENKIKEELEKKIDKLREQSDVNKQEIEQAKAKIDEVVSLYLYHRPLKLKTDGGQSRVCELGSINVVM